MSISAAHASPNVTEYRANISYGSDTALQVYANDTLVETIDPGKTGALSLSLNRYLKPGKNLLRIQASSAAVPITTSPPVAAPHPTDECYVKLIFEESLYINKGKETEVETSEYDPLEWLPADQLAQGRPAAELIVPETLVAQFETPADFDPKQEPSY